MHYCVYSPTIYKIMTDKLTTEAYKGVRDFYPADMAIQRYIFDTWSKTAESFGFERYDSSILEPANLYRSKGAENEELVNEQSYTFTDRGEREVTLRPEMTPTVARLVAGRRRELKFPLRWYSIPNLFRYERPQRGRLREHWQLNCDIFGTNDRASDVEIISLAHQTLINFGATAEMFEILVNDRQEMTALYQSIGITNPETITAITRLNDRKKKITPETYQKELLDILQDDTLAQKVTDLIADEVEDNLLIKELRELGINNAKIDRTIARGFNYYTGMVFEIFDISGENNRALLGGGRYDNLTQLFDKEPISGVGFGLGDVTMRDFLETHKLIKEDIKITAPTLSIIPTQSEQNLEAQKVASVFRSRGVKVAVDIGTKKIGKKISDAAERGVAYVLIVGPDEIASGQFTLKSLKQNQEETGTLDKLSTVLIINHQ